MLQAGGAHRLLATDAKYVGEALGALEMIETRSGEALEEMRTLLDVLRREDDDRVVVAGAVRRPPVDAGDGTGDGAEDGSSSAAGRAGGGRLEGLADLAADARRAGLDVELHQEGDLDDLPHPVAQSAYRIVQESLNNVRRHAYGTRVSVVVRRVGPELEVEVRDDGGRPLWPSDSGFAGTGSGYGLVGMQERAAFLSGEIEVGPAEGGGWAVRARFPVTGR
jgi:signal transduction histidine kinase